MNITAFWLAQRYVGIREAPGAKHNPLILAMLGLDADWPKDDETAWCSAFANWIAWHLRLPRSKSLRARSWLTVGTPVPIRSAVVGWDVVILKRGSGEQPGPEVLDAPGHVGFFAGIEGNHVLLLGGNQGDSVSVGHYALSQVLGVRRLYDE